MKIRSIDDFERHYLPATHERRRQRLLTQLRETDSEAFAVLTVDELVHGEKVSAEMVREALTAARRRRWVSVLWDGITLRNGGNL